MFQLILLLLLLPSLPMSTSISTPIHCTSVHMVEAIRSSSYCKPMLKVVKLNIPGNGSFTQVRNGQESSFIRTDF